MRASSSYRLVIVAILWGLLFVFCSSTTTTLVEAKKVPDQNRFPAVPLDVLLRQPFRLSLLEETSGDDAVDSILSKINAGLGELMSAWMGDSATALLPFFGPGAGVVFNVANNSGRTTGKTLDTRRAEATGLPVVDYTLLNGTILTPSSSSSTSSILFTIEVLIETYYSPIFEEDTSEDREERKNTEREPESQVARSAVTMKLFRNAVSSSNTEEDKEGASLPVTSTSKTLVAAWATHVVKGMPAEEAQAFCKSLAASSGATPATELASRRLSIKPLSMRVRAPGALEAPGRYCLYPTTSDADAITGLATLRFNNYQEALFQVYPPSTTTAFSSSVFPVAVIHLFSKRSILDTVSLSQMLQGIAAPTDLELLFDDAHTVTTAPNTLDDVPQYYVHSHHGKQQKYLSEQHSEDRVGLGGVAASATAGSSSSSSGFGLGIVDATALDSFLPDPQLISARIDGAFLFFYSFYTWSCENWHLIAVGLSVFVSKLCMSVMQNQKDRKDLLQQQMNAKAAAAAKTAAPATVVDEGKKGGGASASNKKGNKSKK